MHLQIVHGRSTVRNPRDKHMRQHSHSTVGHKGVPTLLFDAQELSQPWPPRTTSPVNLTRLLRQVYQRFLPIALRRQVALSLAPRSQPLVTCGKSLMLEWVVSLFMDVALNEMPAYGEVSLGIEVCAEGNCHVILTSLFPGWCARRDPRSRIGSQLRTKERPGAQSRFVMAKALIELHGGRIFFATEEERWTDIVVTLPLVTKREEDFA